MYKTILIYYTLLILRFFASMTVVLLIFNEFYKIKIVSNFLKIKKLGTSNYIAIAILLIFIIWPNIQEANVGNFGIKKLENRIESVESIIKDIFSRKIVEHWTYDEFVKLDSEREGDFYYYELPLKYKPIENSVELWINSELQNPFYYTVEYNERKLICRSMRYDSSMRGIGRINLDDHYGEPVFTIFYTKEE